jgi:hypothetical protein
MPTARALSPKPSAAQVPGIPPGLERGVAYESSDMLAPAAKAAIATKTKCTGDNLRDAAFPLSARLDHIQRLVVDLSVLALRVGSFKGELAPPDLNQPHPDLDADAPLTLKAIEEDTEVAAS